MTTTAGRRNELSASIGHATVKDWLNDCRRGASTIELDRLTALETMIDMATDTEWGLPMQPYREIRETAFATYQSIQCQQGVPFSITILADHLRNEIAAYKEFCDFRDSNGPRGSATSAVTRIDWLASKREELCNPRHKRLKQIRSASRRVYRSMTLAASKIAFRPAVDDTFADKGIRLSPAA